MLIETFKKEDNSLWINDETCEFMFCLGSRGRLIENLFRELLMKNIGKDLH